MRANASDPYEPEHVHIIDTRAQVRADMEMAKSRREHNAREHKRFEQIMVVLKKEIAPIITGVEGEPYKIVMAAARGTLNDIINPIQTAKSISPYLKGMIRDGVSRLIQEAVSTDADDMDADAKYRADAAINPTADEPTEPKTETGVEDFISGAAQILAEAKKTLEDAKAEAGRIVSEAKEEAEEILESARAKAAQIVSEAGKSKKQKIIDLMTKTGSASIDTIRKLTGWATSTVRGFVSRTLRKTLGLTVTCAGGVYSIN